MQTIHVEIVRLQIIALTNIGINIGVFINNIVRFFKHMINLEINNK
jgi:hypothetical protein